MDIGILGPLEVRANDETVDLRRGIPRVLLAALALRVGETLSGDLLAEILWGDHQPKHPENALQVQVSYLRKALAAVDDRPVIVTRPGGYALDVDPSAVDACRFEDLVRRSTETAAAGTGPALESALSTIDEALRLWRGTPLADVPDPTFGIGETTRLVELRSEAIERRNDWLLALGRHLEIVSPLAQLVREEPLRERFHEQLILALYRSGRQADALRAYEAARTTLAEELGLDPGPALQQLERDVLAQAAALAWEPVTGETGSQSPAPAPPPRRRTGRVPAQLSRLVGRDGELTRIEDLLDRTRMVTLTGPAGAGKTRLALEVARRRAETTDVVYVDLGDVSDPDLVPSAVAAAMGIPAPPDEDLTDLISQGLDATLVVLDTCEHLMSGAGLLVSRILREAPSVHVLATSRRPLAISGEMAWPVPPLALPPPSATRAAEVVDYAAVTLFVERARAVRPDFDLADGNASDVAAICFGLDGLPLAIELAAAQADVLTPAAIRARLTNRFALLVHGTVDRAPRQQTLRAAIDWSFDLLDDEQRRLFTRLGVFAGTFDLDAVSAVGPDLADPVQLLATLVRHSLVMVVGDDRYRMLDSLRAYALEMLDDDRAARWHAEHFTYLAEMNAPHIRGPEQVDWLSLIRLDVPNYRAALDWAFEHGEYQYAARIAGALGWFWTLEGMLAEAAQIFERAAAIDDAAPRVRSWIMTGFGLLVASLGDLHRARTLGDQAVALAREADDDDMLGNALNTLAVAQWALGELDAAATTHDEAITRFDAAGDPWGKGLSRVLRARTAIDQGAADATERARAALPLARESGDRHVVGMALEQLARVALTDDDPTTAAAYAEEALELHESIGYTEGIVASLHLLGCAARVQGDLPRAGDAHRRALTLAQDIGHAAAMCEAVEDLALVAAAAGRSPRAASLLASADAERAALGIPRRNAPFETLDAVRTTVASEMPPEPPSFRTAMHQAMDGAP